MKTSTDTVDCYSNSSPGAYVQIYELLVHHKKCDKNQIQKVDGTERVIKHDDGKRDFKMVGSVCDVFFTQLLEPPLCATITKHVYNER